MRDAGVRFAAYALTVSDTPTTAFLSSAVSIRSNENTAWENAMPDLLITGGQLIAYYIRDNFQDIRPQLFLLA